MITAAPGMVGAAPTGQYIPGQVPGAPGPYGYQGYGM